jgi:thiol-disulfide isomerase/thioredoxin
MPSSPSLRTAALALLLGGTLLLPADAGEKAGDLPRYQLQVGQELVYEGSSQFKHTTGTLDSTNSYHIWVVAANPDGSHRLIIRQGSSFSQSGVKSPAQEDVTFGYCDLFPDGRFERNDSFGYRLSPASALPRLPKNAAELARGWTVRDDFLDETTRYRALPAKGDGKLFVFEAERDSPMNPIYGFSFRDVFTFDRARGLMEKMEATNTQDYGFKGKGHGTLALKEVNTHPADWVKKFAAEGAVYFAADKAYRDATDSKSKSLAERKTAIEKAPEGLKAARAKLTLPEWQKQIDHLLTNHDRAAKFLLQEVENQVALLGQPAAEWSTTDLDGKARALKDYRGKVVVMDFWYRGCGWCVRAMPQMKQIAEHFKDKPVVIFGMNTDRDEKDARFVIDKMGLNYPNLKAAGIPEKYKVSGFPTLLIVDQEGVLRDIHVGYSPTLREEVVLSVEGLLNKK